MSGIIRSERDFKRGKTEHEEKKIKYQGDFDGCDFCIADYCGNLLICGAALSERYYGKVQYNQCFAYARTAAHIDGDTIEKYLETGKKDAYYDEIESFLNASQENSGLKYYYVYVPCENDLIYIWDANGDEGACELEDHENYMEGGREVSFAAFQKEP